MSEYEYDCSCNPTMNTLKKSLKAIERIRELHEVYYNDTACSCCEGEYECLNCGWSYPCPTIQTLEDKN